MVEIFSADVSTCSMADIDTSSRLSESLDTAVTRVAAAVGSKGEDRINSRMSHKVDAFRLEELLKARARMVKKSASKL